MLSIKVVSVNSQNLTINFQGSQSKLHGSDSFWEVDFRKLLRSAVTALYLNNSEWFKRCHAHQKVHPDALDVTRIRAEATVAVSAYASVLHSKKPAFIMNEAQKRIVVALLDGHWMPLANLLHATRATRSDIGGLIARKMVDATEVSPGNPALQVRLSKGKE